MEAVNRGPRLALIPGLIAMLPWPKETWSTIEYRDAFVSRTVEVVAKFKDRIHAWEIWNEEYIGYSPGSLGGETYMSPLDYAYLLGGDRTGNDREHPWAARQTR